MTDLFPRTGVSNEVIPVAASKSDFRDILTLYIITTPLRQFVGVDKFNVPFASEDISPLYHWIHPDEILGFESRTFYLDLYDIRNRFAIETALAGYSVVIKNINVRRFEDVEWRKSNKIAEAGN